MPSNPTSPSSNHQYVNVSALTTQAFERIAAITGHGLTGGFDPIILRDGDRYWWVVGVALPGGQIATPNGRASTYRKAERAARRAYAGCRRRGPVTEKQISHLGTLAALAAMGGLIEGLASIIMWATVDWRLGASLAVSAGGLFVTSAWLINHRDKLHRAYR